MHGSTRSTAVIYETEPEVSEGHLNLTHVIPAGSDSVTLTWTALPNHSGPVEKYVLSCTPMDSIEPCVSYEGQETSATIWNLVPFSHYRFSVHGCTSGGCLHSLPITVTTAQAPPQRLRPPAIRKISSSELHIEWSPPGKPNGKNLMPRILLLLGNRDSRNEELYSKMGNSLCLCECKPYAWEMISEDINTISTGQ